MIVSRPRWLLCAVLLTVSTTPLQAFAPARPAASTPAAATAKAATQAPAQRPAKLVDINSASLAELKTLPGIGDAEAARIVAARPYPSKAKLVAEGVIGMAEFTRLKDRIEARQAVSPAAGKNPHARQTP